MINQILLIFMLFRKIIQIQILLIRQILQIKSQISIK